MYLKIGVACWVVMIMLGITQAQSKESTSWGVEPWWLGNQIDVSSTDAKLIYEDVDISMTAFGRKISCQIDAVYQDEYVPFNLASSSLATTAYIGALDDEIFFVQLVFDENFPQTLAVVKNQLIDQYGDQDGAVVFDGEEVAADGTKQYSWRFHQPASRQAVSVTYIVPPAGNPMLVVEFTGGVLTRIFYEALNAGLAESS